MIEIGPYDHRDDHELAKLATNTSRELNAINSEMRKRGYEHQFIGDGSVRFNKTTTIHHK